MADYAETKVWCVEVLSRCCQKKKGAQNRARVKSLVVRGDAETKGAGGSGSEKLGLRVTGR
jgi:hypothetical protein